MFSWIKHYRCRSTEGSELAAEILLPWHHFHHKILMDMFSKHTALDILFAPPESLTLLCSGAHLHLGDEESEQSKNINKGSWHKKPI